jgi:Amt family ammonium transporter
MHVAQPWLSILLVSGGYTVWMYYGVCGCLWSPCLDESTLLTIFFSFVTVHLSLSGYALAFGGQNDRTDTTFVGTTDFVDVGPSAAFWFFQYTFSATSVTIVAGTLAERCQMSAYLCYSVFLAGFVYPVVAHTVWSNNGVLSITNVNPFLDIGSVDFAGSGVVHVTGGTTALFATLVLGPRRGRFFDAQGEPLETPAPFPGHSVALQLLGTMILWFGCKSSFLGST